MDEGQRKAPRVFISYSHDSEEHRDRAFRLCEELRLSLIDATIDQYEEEDPPQDWPTWMFQQLDGADYVLMICTEPYKLRAQDQEEPGKGLGARFETSIITNAIYRTARLAASSPYIPIIFDKADRAHIPYFVAGSTNYLLDTDTWEGLDPVVRRIKGERRVVRMPLGGYSDPQPEPEPEQDPKTVHVELTDNVTLSDQAEATVVSATPQDDRHQFIKELLVRWTNMDDLTRGELVRGLSADEQQLVLDSLSNEQRDHLARQNKVLKGTTVDLSNAAMRRLKAGGHFPHPLGEMQESERRALQVVQTDMDLESILFDALAAAQRHKPNSDVLFLHLDRIIGQFGRIVGEQLNRPVSVEIWDLVSGSRPMTARCLASADTPVFSTLEVNGHPDFAQATINGISHTKGRDEMPSGTRHMEHTTYGIKATKQDKLPVGWLRMSWSGSTGDGQFFQIVGQHLVARLGTILYAVPRARGNAARLIV